MESAVVSLICGALMIIGSVTLVTSAMHSADSVSRSWKEMARVAQERAETRISEVGSRAFDDGATVLCIIRNEGAASLDGFESWDVIVQYGDGGAAWLPYGAQTPGWTVDAIQYKGDPEVFDPGMLNPGEDARLLIKLHPAVSENATNRVVVSTANGARAESIFKR